MLDLPAGEVTFLFTDVESSTALWERDPEAMAAAVADHDQLLHRAVSSNGGIVFKGLGDGVCAVFDSAGNAVAAALEGQHALHTHAWETEEPLRVRMAVLTGSAQLRGDDYFGTTLNRTARLMATAHGGQVVLSESAATRAEDLLPPGASLVDLGLHRLKDLSQPVRVFQLNHPELRRDCPPLRSLGFFRGNLPHRVTEFIGREAEIATLRDLLAANRLVTLAGTGGVGKTSLAIRTAAEQIEEFADGVWLVELAPLTDGTQIPGAAAGVFGVDAPSSLDLTEVLIRHLAPLETLLILDNCEHLIDAAAKLTDAILHATKQVGILATSREPLRVDSEAIFRVPTLELPPGDAVFDKFRAVDSVALFIDRAGLAFPGFNLDADNAAATIEICRRLDGIPLAIELAAARLDTLDVAQLAGRLDDRFRVLTKGSRAALPRHRTLEGLVDWSHDLLAEPEQLLLRRLGAFGGSFTLDGTEQVCGYEPLEPSEVADGLDRLVETSLISAPEPPSDRYRMLETIRAYARVKLDRADEIEGTMRRLATYLLEAGPATHKGRPEGDWVEWLQWRDDERDSYRAALEWARTADDGLLCAALVVEFERYLAQSSLGEEAEAWAESALELLPDEPSSLRLQLLEAMATRQAQVGEADRARTVIRAYRNEAEALGDEVATAWVMTLEALFTAYVEDDLESGLAMITEAGDRLLATGDQRYEGTVVFAVYLLSLLGRYDEAEAMVDRLESQQKEIGVSADWGYRSDAFRGIVAFWRGDYARAIDLKRSCVEPARRIGPRELGAQLVHQGEAEFGLGNYESAALLIEEGRSLLPDDATAYVGLLTIAPLVDLETRGPDAAVAGLRNAVDAAAAPDGGFDRVEVFTAIAEWAIAADRPAEAAVLLGAATAARDRVAGLVPHAWVRQHHERATNHVQHMLSPDHFERLSNEGRNLTPEEAAERARTFLHETPEE